MDGIREWLTDICLIGAAAFSVAWLVFISRGRLARVADRIAKMPRSAVAAFLIFAAIATVCAQKSGTNEPPRGAYSPLVVGSGPSVTPEDVARGYRLVGVTTNAAYSYAMPTNGTRHGKWWLRGAYEDVFPLDLGGMRFPLGTDLLASLWVYAWGMAGARLGDVSNAVAATGVPMSAVPRLSQFWSAAEAGGSRLLTWQDFALARDTNTPVSAQLELMPSGDFVARSNLVERVYRRVNPDDLDDDGDPNDTDPDPLAYGGDNFGPHQELPEGANSNAYCWVDLVVPNANALVTFTGDGPSDLPDPRFVARAGETNRVTVLIGKTYRVTCPMPIVCTDRSGHEIEVWQDQGSPTEMYICWPVSIEAVSMRGGASFSMFVWPDFLGGGFIWTNSCCTISASGWTFTYSCGGTCTCTGCGALGCYGYEGYRIPADGVACGCGRQPGDGDGGEREDDGPYDAGAGVSFSKSAVIFEDRYENEPGAWIERQSTRTELNCVAHGGPNGGHVRFEVAGEEKLGRVSGNCTFPFEGDVGPGMKIDFTIVYNGKLPSSAAEDIIVTSTFTENVQGATQEVCLAKLTSIKVELSSLNVSLDEYPNRHIRGIGEQLSCEWTPSVSGLSFQTWNGAVCFKSYSNRRDVICPFQAVSGVFEISAGGASYIPAVQVLEPTGIVARNPHKLSCSVPNGSPGGAGFSMGLYIMPDTVSFQALDFWERPATNSTIEGYFTNQAFRAVWYHDTSMGAGVWHKIGDGNFWFEDSPQMGDELITPVYSGRLVWHIPIDWRKHDDSTLILQGFKSVDQTFEMSATGRLTVYKYQHWAAREMSGETFKSEGMTE